MRALRHEIIVAQAPRARQLRTPSRRDGASCHHVDTSTPAVVLKFDPNVMHHGCLGVIRSLGRLGVDVYGVHESRFAPAASSSYLTERCIWRPDAGDEQRVLEGLRAIASRIGRRAVLFTTDDVGAIFVAEHRDALRESFLFPEPPEDLPRRLAGKLSMHELCAELGVPSPRVAVAASREEATAFALAVGFPLVAKLTSPWHAGAGGRLRSTQVVRDDAQLAEVLDAGEQHGVQHLLQEYIPGGPDTDWFFHGYCDATSACQPAFTGVKHRSYPAHAGLTSYGVSADNQLLRDEMRALLARIGYRGIMDLDLRFDRRDGTYKLLDFNPRLGAQFRIFRTTADVDVAIAQYLDLTGTPIPAGEPLEGRGFVVESYDPLSALSYLRRGELDARSWLASLRGTDELAWFASDDLRPFGLMCLRMGWRLATRPLSTRLRRDGQPRFVSRRTPVQNAPTAAAAPQLGPEQPIGEDLRRAA